MAHSPTFDMTKSCASKTAPTAFLTLPIELQQKIIFETYKFSTTKEDISNFEDTYYNNYLVSDIDMIQSCKPDFFTGLLRTVEA